MGKSCMQVEEFLKQPTRSQDGVWVRPQSVCMGVDGAGKSSSFLLRFRGFGKFIPSLIKCKDSFFRFLGVF